MKRAAALLLSTLLAFPAHAQSVRVAPRAAAGPFAALVQMELPRLDMPATILPLGEVPIFQAQNDIRLPGQASPALAASVPISLPLAQPAASPEIIDQASSPRAQNDIRARSRVLVDEPAAERRPSEREQLTVFADSIAQAPSEGTARAFWDGDKKKERGEAVPAAARTPRRRSGLARAAAGFAPLAALTMPDLSQAPAWAWTAGEVGLTLAVTWAAARAIAALSRRLLARRSDNPLLQAWLARASGGLTWVVGIGVALAFMGLSSETLAANAGLYSFALSVAIKDALRSFVNGWFFSLRRPFKSGDHVRFKVKEDGKDFEHAGRVTSANGRYVTLDLSEDPAASFERVLVPNEIIAPENIYNRRRALPAAGSTLGFLSFLPAGAHTAIAVGATIAATVGAAWLARKIARGGSRKVHVDPEVTDRVAAFVSVLVYFGGFFVVLSILGIPLSSLLTGAGLLAIILGFVASEFANNFAAGAMFAIYRPFHIGQHARIGDAEGTVADIGFHYIALELPDGTEGGYRTVHIPSFELMRKRIFLGKKTPA